MSTLLPATVCTQSFCARFCFLHLFTFVYLPTRCDPAASCNMSSPGTCILSFKLNRFRPSVSFRMDSTIKTNQKNIRLLSVSFCRLPAISLRGPGLACFTMFHSFGTPAFGMLISTTSCDTLWRSDQKKLTHQTTAADCQHQVQLLRNMVVLKERNKSHLFRLVQHVYSTCLHDFTCAYPTFPTCLIPLHLTMRKLLLLQLQSAWSSDFI